MTAFLAFLAGAVLGIVGLITFMCWGWDRHE